MPTFRYAIRSLTKSPVFATVAIISLALALAVNTTMFALIDAVIHPAVPYHGVDRVFTVRYAAAGKETRQGIAQADEHGDADTADLLTVASRYLDKSLYFLESHLQGDDRG